MLERRNSAPAAFASLDETDRRILAELQDDARLRTSELARRVGLSAPAVADRVRRLEDTGVVSYRAEIEPRALGYPVCTLVRVSPSSGNLHQIPLLARGIPGVTECYRVTGDDCYVIKLYLRSMDDLEAILDQFAPLGRTTTSIMHSAPVPRRPLPLDG